MYKMNDFFSRYNFYLFTGKIAIKYKNMPMIKYMGVLVIQKWDEINCFNDNIKNV